MHTAVSALNSGMFGELGLRKQWTPALMAASLRDGPAEYKLPKEPVLQGFRV